MSEEITFPDLTPKQNAFVEAYLSTGSPSSAYRAAYNVVKSSPTVVAINASKAMKNPKVKARINELRAVLAEECHWDRVDSISVLAEIARKEKAKDSDRVNAVKAINTMLGYDKVTIDHTTSDGSMTPTTITRVIIDPKDKNGDSDA